MSPLDLACTLCLETGNILLAGTNRSIEIQEKAPHDLVTEIDRASEAHIVRRLQDLYPNSSILVEESGLFQGSGDDRWIVDPLDGTTNYAHGYPAYCVSIGYERKGEIIAGAIYAPAHEELFCAEKGAGAQLNGRELRVSRIAGLSHALLAAGFAPSKFQLNERQFRVAYPNTQGVRHDGSAALDLAYVAAGRFDAFWEYALKPWDIAAGLLCVEEAGGTVSRPDGRCIDLDEGSILASNSLLHQDVLALIEASRP